MLIRLLRTHLRPYYGLLACVLVLEFAQVMASLYLPTLNADIINRGVATGDTGYIWRTGGLMLAVSAAQGACTMLATYLAARSAMGLGRDLRAKIFHRVGSFSEREVSGFGAGSLITRNTNDVQQIQMLVLMGCTMLVMAPIMAVGGIIMAVTRAPGLAWLVAVSVPVLLAIVGLIVRRMVPLFRSYQDRLDGINRVLREQLTGIRVIRAFVRERAEAASPASTMTWRGWASASGASSSSCSRWSHSSWTSRSWASSGTAATAWARATSRSAPSSPSWPISCRSSWVSSWPPS